MSHALSDGQRAFICQFSLLSALHDLKTLKQLSHSPESRERAIYGKILKNAAVLHMVTARKGPYKKFGKKETAEQAI